MNADEARKCLAIAREAISKNDFTKAERFLVKSIKLHETSEAQGLLQRLDSIKKTATEEAVNKKKTTEKAKQEAAAPEPPKPFTKEEA